MFHNRNYTNFTLQVWTNVIFMSKAKEDNVAVARYVDKID